MASFQRKFCHFSILFTACWVLLNFTYFRLLPSNQPLSDPDHTQVHLKKTDEIESVIEDEAKIRSARISLTPDELLDIVDGMERHSFNVSMSDSTPFDREVPDFRPQQCPMKYNIYAMPSVSVIICFHNEALSTLLRTIHSVIRTTRMELLQEIILVDDASTYDYLGRKLEKLLKPLKNVHLLRTNGRLGIAQARNRGTSKAVGDVLVFLDSHCECGDSWLEPLLQEIMENPKQIVCPEVDIINHQTFQYSAPDQSYEGSFDWELNLVLRPLTVPHTDAHMPFRTGTMLGGIFAVEKRYFRRIGVFAREMEIWGGENIELSFRVWICGGSINIIPCSRVGHVFRPVIPYGFPKYGARAIIHRNNQRVAEGWMDSFKKYYYGAARQEPTMNAVMMRQFVQMIRERNECKDFYWYLTNVIPGLPIPPDDAEYFGQIHQTGTSYCIVLQHLTKFTLVKCVPQKLNQAFHLSTSGQLMHGNQCLHMDHIGTNITSVSMKLCGNEAIHCSLTELSQIMCRGPSSSSQSVCLQSSGIDQPVDLHTCTLHQSHDQAWKFTHHIDLDIMNSIY